MMGSWERLIRALPWGVIGAACLFLYARNGYAFPLVMGLSGVGAALWTAFMPQENLDKQVQEEQRRSEVEKAFEAQNPNWFVANFPYLNWGTFLAGGLAGLLSWLLLRDPDGRLTTEGFWLCSSGMALVFAGQCLRVYVDVRRLLGVRRYRKGIDGHPW